MIGTILLATICQADPVTLACVGQHKDVQASIDMPVKFCESQAQNLLAQLMQEYPNWRVERYQCQLDNGKKKIDI